MALGTEDLVLECGRVWMDSRASGLIWSLSKQGWCPLHINRALRD